MSPNSYSSIEETVSLALSLSTTFALFFTLPFLPIFNKEPTYLTVTLGLSLSVTLTFLPIFNKEPTYLVY